MRARRYGFGPPFHDPSSRLAGSGPAFSAKLFEGVSTHGAEGGIDPLHWAVRPRHHEASGWDSCGLSAIAATIRDFGAGTRPDSAPDLVQLRSRRRQLPADR